MKLVHAYHINELFEIDGHPIHIEESPDIIWTTKRRVIRSAAAVEAEQERLSKSKASNHGVRIAAIPTLRQGAKWPTRKSWADSKAVPEPSGTKMADLAIAQERRAKERLAAMEQSP